MFGYMVKHTSRLRRDEGGQSLIFVAVLGLVLVLFAVAVINVGNLASTRIRMQGAADAGAQTTGVWMARGMNMISTLNLAMTQALALIVILKSMDGMHTAAEIGQEIQQTTGEALESNPYTAAIGAVLVALAESIGTLAVDGLEYAKEYADDGVDALWQVINGISIAEEVLARAIPLAAYTNALGIVRMNGADLGVGIPPVPSPTIGDEGESAVKEGLLFALPVKKGSLQDVCARSAIGGTVEGLKLRHRSDANNDSPWGRPPCDRDPHATPPTRSERRWSSCNDDRGDPAEDGGQTYLSDYHGKLRIVFAVFSLGTMGATSIAWEVIPRYEFYDICGGNSPAAATQTMQIGQCEVCRGNAAARDGKFHPEARELKWNVYVVENQIPNQSSFNTALTGGGGSVSNDTITDFQSGGNPPGGGSPHPVDPNVKLLGSYEQSGPKSRACNNGSGDLYPPHRTETSGPDGHSSGTHIHTFYRRIVSKFSTCKIDMTWQGSSTNTSDDDKDKAKPLMLKVEPKEKMKNDKNEEEEVDFYKKHLDVAIVALAGHDKVKPPIFDQQFTDPYSGDTRTVFKDPLENPVASMFTFGQVHVFNQRSEDLFTPDWKAVLVRFDMHERFDILSSLGDVLNKVILH